MSRCVDGSSSSSSSRRLREAGRQQHALPLAAAQRLHQPIAQIPAVGAPHRPLDRRADPRPTRTSDRCADSVPSARARRRETADRAAPPAADARPAARASRGSHVASDRSSSRTAPPVGCRRPATMSSSVLLPAPLRPITTATLAAAHVERDARQHRRDRRRCHATFSIRSRTLIAPVRSRSSAGDPFGGLDDARSGTTSASVVAAWSRPVLTAVSVPYALHSRSLIGCALRAARRRCRPCRRCRR